MDCLQEAKNINDEIISLRRKIHMNPELGYEEINTSLLIKEYLKKEGIQYKEYAGTGVCGIIKGLKEGKEVKTIALRADIDALPIEEENKCEYKSKNKGKMHACGHDGHTAILLGVAKILNRNKHLFSGNVKLIFEPAEETTGGAKVMIEEHVLENPVVDMVCGLHVEETLEVGTIMLREGTVNAASNPFKITIEGSGGHGAYPHMCVDPIVIASHVVLAIQEIISREICPLNPALITVGSINGGTAMNIIPGKVEISGIIRCITKEDRELIKKRITEVVNGICLTFRGKAKIEIEESYPCLINDDNMVSIAKNSATKILGQHSVLNQKNPKMGVESFAYFANEVPSVFYFLGAKKECDGIVYPAHNSKFDINEQCLHIGVAIQCQIALDYLTT